MGLEIDPLVLRHFLEIGVREDRGAWVVELEGKDREWNNLTYMEKVQVEIKGKITNKKDDKILWEKKVWRVVDVREKINLPFMYPEKPFFEIMTKAALDNQIDLYSAEFDDFSKPLY